MKKLLILILVVLTVIGCRGVPPEYSIVKEGYVFEVQYTPSAWESAEYTIITFVDTSTVVIKGIHTIPCSHIRILHKQKDEVSGLWPLDSIECVKEGTP